MAADVSQWDETLCDKAVCQHPQCWDTLRRIEEGHPRVRLRNSTSMARMLLGREDEFPTLKIVNMPPGQSLRRCFRCSKCHRTFSISAAPSPLNSVPQADGSGEDSAVSSERPVFPGLNSTAGSNIILPREMSFMVLNNVGRLRMFHFPEIAPPKQGCSSESGNLIVKWVPSKRHQYQKHGQPALPELKPGRQLSVRDLASESLIDLKEVQNQGADMRRLKSRKIPAGGQPNLLYPKRNYPSKTTKSLLNYKTEGFAGKDGILSLSCPDQLQIATVVELQDEGGLKLMNRQPGFPHAKSKSSRPLLVQKLSSRLDIVKKLHEKWFGIYLLHCVCISKMYTVPEPENLTKKHFVGHIFFREAKLSLYFLEQSVPVMVDLKEKNVQRLKTSQYLKKPIRIKTRPDSMPLRLLSRLGEQPGCSSLSVFPTEFLQRCTSGGREQPPAQLALSLGTFAERGHRGGESPVVQLVDVWRTRPSGQSVLGKSSSANLAPLGVEEHGQPLASAGSWDSISCRCALSRGDDAWTLGCLQGGQYAGRAVPLFKEECEDDSSYNMPPPPPPSPCLQEDYTEDFSERKFLPFEGLSSNQDGLLC